MVERRVFASPFTSASASSQRSSDTSTSSKQKTRAASSSSLTSGGRRKSHPAVRASRQDREYSFQVSPRETEPAAAVRLPPARAQIPEYESIDIQRQPSTCSVDRGETEPARRRRRRPRDDHHLAQPRPTRARYSTDALYRRIASLSAPSLLSVVSAKTHTSGSSSSTITQQSYDRFQIRRRKRRVRAKQRETERTESPRRRPLTQHTPDQTRTESSMDADSPLRQARPMGVKDEMDEELADQTPPAADLQSQLKEVLFGARRHRRYSWASQDRFNSDSGISVTSGSPEYSRAVADGDDEQEVESDDGEQEAEGRPTATARNSSQSLPARFPRALPDPDPLVRRIQQQEEEMRQHVLHSPQPRRVSRPPNSAPPVSLYDHSPVYGPSHGFPFPQHMNQPYPPMMYPARPYPPPIEPDLSKTTLAGYELIASKLTGSRSPEAAAAAAAADDDDAPIAAVYRKFETLNHPILLHLQDEIAEMEEELRLVDERIAQVTPQVEKERLQPASRRQEVEYGGDYYRRTELLGKIFLKLGQYNQALAAYSSAGRNFVPADAADVRAYRAFLDRAAPIEPDESRFLLHEADLMALPKRRPQPQQQQQQHQHQHQHHQQAAPEAPRVPGLLLAAGLLGLPPVFCAVFPTLSARVVAALLLGAAAVGALSATDAVGAWPAQHRAVGATLYFTAVGLFAAIV